MYDLNSGIKTGRIAQVNRKPHWRSDADELREVNAHAEEAGPALARFILLALGVAAITAGQSTAVSPSQPAPAKAAVLLETLSWDEAEKILKPDTVVCDRAWRRIQGAWPPSAAQQRLFDGRIPQETSSRRGPAKYGCRSHHQLQLLSCFLEYPGSTSLSVDTARAMITDIVYSLRTTARAASIYSTRESPR